MTYLHSNIKYFFFFTLFLLLFVRCEDDTAKPFPYVYIDATFYVDTQLNGLPVGEYMFIDKYGYGGLIIYHNMTGFQAFDRACTYDPNKKRKLEEDEDYGDLVTCPCCRSRFLISQDGMVFGGPATRGLKQYNAFLVSPNELKVKSY